jgi:hypothetical protein
VAIFGLVLRHRLLASLAFALVRLASIKSVMMHLAHDERRAHTWNLFLELPGRLNNLFSPILREPSLILLDVDVKGSGAATLDNF